MEVTSNAEMSSPVAHPSGTGRFRRVAKSLYIVSAIIFEVLSRHLLLLCLINFGDELLGQRLAVNLHSITIAGTAADGDI